MGEILDAALIKHIYGTEKFEIEGEARVYGIYRNVTESHNHQ